MKRLLVCLVAAVCGTLSASAEFVWPESGEATIPKGETVVVTDADYAKVNALEKITIAEGATNVFATTKAPTVLFGGAGTFIKRGGAAWTLTTEQKAFYGSYIIEAGVVTNAVSSGWGYTWCSDYKDVNRFVVKISDGAMFVNTATDATTSFGPRWVHLKGTGVNGEGAIVNLSNSKSYISIQRPILDGDALISAKASQAIYFSNYSGMNGTVDCNGYELTVDAPNARLQVNSTTLVGSGTIRLKSGNLTLSGGVEFDTEPDHGGFILEKSATIQISADIPAVPVPLAIGENATVLLVHTHASDYACRMSETTNNWTGPVSVAEGALLKVTARKKFGADAMRISGQVSGAGSLAGIVWDPYFGGIYTGDAYLESSNNVDFAGMLYMTNNINRGSVYLSYSNSVPNYANVRAQCGFLTARMGQGEHAWTAPSLMALVDGVNWLSEPHWITVDARPAEDETVRFCAADLEAATDSPTVRLGADGGVTELAGTFTKPLEACAVSGTLKLTGGIEAVLTNTFATSLGTNRFGVLALDGAKRIVTGRDGLRIGSFLDDTTGAWPIPISPIGRMTVRNSTWVTDYWPETNAEDCFDGAIKVGWNRRGILEIEEGSVVSNRFLVGSGLKSDNPHPKALNECNYGYGSVCQRGGEVYMLGSKEWSSLSCGSAFASTFGTYGFFEATGGKTVIGGMFVLGGHGAGIMYVNGGDVVATNYWSNTPGATPIIYVAGANDGDGILYVKKGRCVFPGETYLASGGTGGTEAIVTTDGPEAFVDLGATVLGVVNMPMSNYVCCNLNNGGVVRARTFCPRNTRASNPRSVFVNFDGGVFRARSYNYDIFGNADSPDVPTSVVRVYGGGATIDSAGIASVLCSAEIRAAEGKGVESIPWAPKGGYIGAPRVLIEGDGYGATAIAEFDSKTGTVTGFRVTSRGCGYTQAKAVVSTMYMDVAAEEIACVLSDNDATGSFTKAGAGTLTLNAANDWGGATLVAGGTLKAGVEGAIPANRDLFLSGGGVLDLNGTATTIRSVTYGAGAGSIVNAGAATVPSDFAMEIAADEVKSGESIPFRGDADLTGKTLTVTGVFESLDPKVCKRYRILSVANGSLTGAPTIVAEPLPKGWSFRVTKSGVTLAYDCGMVLLVR